MEELQKIISVFEKHTAKSKIGFAEILTCGEKGEFLSTISKTLIAGFEAVPFANIENSADYLTGAENFIKFETKSGEKKVFCILLTVVIKNSPVFALLLQSQNPFSDDAAAYLESASAILFGAMSILKTSVDGKDREYKSNLMSVRQMQAMLFPSFDNVEGLDVGAVYLPSQLMSGNFIDAFFISEDIYQIAVCVVSGYDATSSFVGAAVRTLVRSVSSASLTSSNMIELLIQKLSKLVAGVTARVTICVYQINIKSSRLSVSSFGALDTLLYVAKKKNAISLNDTQIGRDLSKRNTYKELTFSLDKGDSILFYSQGVLTAEAEDGTGTFGMPALWDKFKTGIDLSSNDHVQNISQSIFEFINYTPIKDDILILRVKKN